MTIQDQRVAAAEISKWKRQDGEEPTYGGKYIQSGWFDPAGNFHRGSVTKKEEGTPNFPEDANAAEELTKTAAREGWKCRLDNGLDETWECIFYKGEPNTPGYEEHYAPGGTMSLAITQAALRAKGRWVQEGETL